MELLINELKNGEKFKGLVAFVELKKVKEIIEEQMNKECLEWIDSDKMERF